jgi:hypothetical protein
MYPAVKRAYAAKVPHELSETEFWTQYYQSEYFTRDKGVKQNVNSNTDDMFSRYEDIKDSNSFNTYTISNNKNDIIKNKKIKLNTNDIIHTDVDITANYGDYNKINSINDDVYDTFPKASGVISKYNRHSQLILNKQHQNIHKQNLLNKNYNIESSFLNELINDDNIDNNFIPLELHIENIANDNKQIESLNEKNKMNDKYNNKEDMEVLPIIKEVSISDILQSVDKCKPNSNKAKSFLSIISNDMKTINNQNMNSDDIKYPQDFKQVIYIKY